MSIMQQIAEEVGVSERTVARILSGEGKGVWASTARRREQVLAAAERLNYRPNLAARALAEGRFRQLALVMSAQEKFSSLSSQTLTALHDAAAARGYLLTLARLDDDRLTDRAFLPNILKYACSDGLLINYNANYPQAMAQMVQDHQIPAVWLNAGTDAQSIRPDDYAGGYEAAERLIQAGHRRIAYADFGSFEAPSMAHCSVVERRRGYEAAMKAAGLDPLLFCNAPAVWSVPERRFRYAMSELSNHPRPTAVVAYADYSAYPLLCAAYALQMSVPSDLSLVTFGDRILNQCGIQISTMVTEVHAMAAAAIDAIDARIKKLPVPASTAVPYRFEPAETFCARSAEPSGISR